MRVIYSDDYREIAVEDRGAYLVVYEKSNMYWDSNEFQYKGFVLKMSEPKRSLVERCKQCISNHDFFRPQAIGLDGQPVKL